jgi:hypothetical protein
MFINIIPGFYDNIVGRPFTAGYQESTSIMTLFCLIFKVVIRDHVENFSKNFKIE